MSRDSRCPRCGAPVTTKVWPPPLCGTCATVDRQADEDLGIIQDRTRDRTESQWSGEIDG